MNRRQWIEENCKLYEREKKLSQNTEVKRLELYKLISSKNRWKSTHGEKNHTEVVAWLISNI